MFPVERKRTVYRVTIEIDPADSLRSPADRARRAWRAGGIAAQWAGRASAITSAKVIGMAPARIDVDNESED